MMATIGVKRPADNAATANSETLAVQTESPCRCARLSKSSAIATDARSTSNATPGQPAGNIEKSRCTLARVLGARVAGYSRGR